MCVDEVRSALESVKRVREARVSLEKGEAIVIYDRNLVEEEDLIKTVKNAQGMHLYEDRVKRKDGKGQREGGGAVIARAGGWSCREGVIKIVQTRKHLAGRKALIGTFAFVLCGLAFAIPISAVDHDPELREVKVEHKPKFISNGAGQRPFDVTRHSVPLSDIQRSVPKDAIPALVHPKFMTVSDAGKLLNDKDRVLGVFLSGEAKAYPVRILNWHELVNDEVGGQPILVSW